MHRRRYTLSVLCLFCGALMLYACHAPEPPPLDVVPPSTTAIPAGGIYRSWPAAITLVSEAGAKSYYRWESGKEQPYTDPIQASTDGSPHRTLYFWSEDTAGNREALRREHYVLDPQVPSVEFVDLDRSVLGGQETTTLRWRSSATNATYTIAATHSGWGPGMPLAHGVVQPDEAQHITIAASALFEGDNRLWLRVKNAAGAVAATSRLLTVHTTPVPTRAWPPSGVFGSPQTVALLTERPATIYYTLDGTEPRRDSMHYTEPLTIDRTMTLRFFSVDPHGNQEAPQHAQFTIQPQTATITLPTLVPSDIGGETPLRLTWRSDRDGRYDVVLQSQHEQRQLTVQQGMVERHQDIHTTIARNFLSPGDWQVRLQVRPSSGQLGEIAFTVRAHYRDGFADTRYHNVDATTATWDTARQHVSLSRGPRLLGTYRTRGRGRRVTVRGPHAYLATSTDGLHIVDISDPRQPQRAGGFYPHGTAMALAIYDHYVYMAASRSGMAIFDVSQPARPRLVAMVPLQGTASDITIVAPYAYVGTQQGRLILFDLTMPLQPRRLGQVEVGGRVVDIAVHAGMAHLACLDQGLVMVDVSTPQQPRVHHRWPTPSAATGVAVSGNRVLVSAATLEVLDVTQPDTPTSLIRHDVRSAYGVAAVPPYAVVASGSDGIQVVSMTERSPVTSSPTGHYAARLAIRGQHALVADTRGGLQVLDLSQPTRPQVVGTVQDIGTIVDVAWEGTVAYLANDSQGSGLVVVDLSDLTSPRVIGGYHSQATTDVAVWENWALLSDAAGLVQLVDIEHVSRPQLRSTLLLPGKLQRLALLPPYALVAGDEAGVHVLEVTAAGQLRFHTTVAMPGRALDIAWLDSTAAIAAMDGGIQVLDVQNPLAPTLGMPYHHPDAEGDHIIRLIAAQNTLYAIDNQRGIQVIKRSDDGRLQLQHGITVPRGAPWGLSVVGPYLFVSTLLHSLYGFDLTISSQPQLLSTSPYGGAALASTGTVLAIAVRGRSGVPGGLRLVEGFATVAEDTMYPFQARGVTSLPGPTLDTRWVHRAYTFHTPGVAESVAVSSHEVSVQAARLHVHDFWGSTGRIAYALSNDGGTMWHTVQPGAWLHFPTSGNELRWRAILETADVMITPVIEQVRIDVSARGR